MRLHEKSNDPASKEGGERRHRVREWIRLRLREGVEQALPVEPWGEHPGAQIDFVDSGAPGWKNIQSINWQKTCHQNWSHERSINQLRCLRRQRWRLPIGQEREVREELRAIFIRQGERVCQNSKGAKPDLRDCTDKSQQKQTTKQDEQSDLPYREAHGAKTKGD